MLTKLKDFLNSLKSKLFALFSNSFSLGRFIRILLKIKLIQFVWIAAILLKCLIYMYPLFGAQVGLEDLNSFQMAVDVTEPQKLAKVVATSKVSDISVVSQKSDFGEKSISEFSRSFIEILQTDQLERCFDSSSGKIVGYSSADNSTNKSTNNGGLNSNIHDDLITSPILVGLAAFVVAFLFSMWLVDWLIWRFFPPYKT